MNSEENSEDFCPNYVQEFCLCAFMYMLFYYRGIYLVRPSTPSLRPYPTPPWLAAPLPDLHKKYQVFIIKIKNCQFFKKANNCPFSGLKSHDTNREKKSMSPHYTLIES
jgi:hypothetical protein